MKDYSSTFCQMYTGEVEGKIPMYSYDRPAYIVWSAFMNGLIAAGFTEQEAIEWLCSKETRWALDGDFGEMLRAIAFNYAKEVKK